MASDDILEYKAADQCLSGPAWRRRIRRARARTDDL